MGEPKITHTEEIARKWFPGTNEMRVSVTRTARLDDTLAAIESRRLTHIGIDWQRGEVAAAIDREQAEWLRDALTDALGATAEFASSRTESEAGQ